MLILPTRGHSSVAFLNRSVDRLKEKQRQGKKIVILYFGDADPLGELMRVYKRELIEYGIHNVEFVRLAVTKEQMDRFSLLQNPDPQILKKLKKRFEQKRL